MNRDRLYIFQTADNEIFAHTTDTNEAWGYIKAVVDEGFSYYNETNGIATIFTIVNQNI